MEVAAHPTARPILKYTRPWTVEMPLQITLDTELIDEIGLENEQSSRRMRSN